MNRRRQQYDPYYGGRSKGAFDDIPAMEYVPQYMGLPLEEMSQTGDAFYQNFAQFEIGKDSLQTAMESLLHETTGANKEHAERITQNAQEKIAEIAEAKDFSRMGLDILSLSNQYKQRVLPLMGEKAKIDKQRELILSLDVPEEDRRLMLDNLDYKAGTSGLEYEQGTFKITGGGFKEDSLLNPVADDDVVTNALQQVSHDSWGVTFDRAYDIANNQLDLQKDFQSYVNHKLELYGNVLRGRLASQGNMSEADIEKTVGEALAQKKAEIIDPIRQQIIDKLVNNQQGDASKGPSSRSGSNKDPFKRPEIDEEINIFGTQLTDHKELTTLIENSTKNLENLDAEYAPFRRELETDGDTPAYQYIETVGGRDYDRTEEYQHSRNKILASQAEYQSVYNTAWEKTQEYYRVMHGEEISLESLGALAENAIVPSAPGVLPIAGEIGIGAYDIGQQVTSGEYRRLTGIKNKFNEFIKDVTEETVETVTGLATFDEQTGDQHIYDRQLAVNINEKRDTVRFVNMNGDQDEKAHKKYQDPDSYNLNPTSRIFNARTGEYYTIANVEERDGSGWKPTKESVIIANDSWWRSQMDDFEVISTNVLAHTNTLMPRENSKTITARDYAEMGRMDFLQDVAYDIAVLRDGKYAVTINDKDGRGQYEIINTRQQARSYIHRDIMERLNQAALDEIEEAGESGNAFERRRVSSQRPQSTTSTATPSRPTAAVSHSLEEYFANSPRPLLSKFIFEKEAFRTEGYIPMQNGEVMGNSGVTIGIGVDLGQQTASDLRNSKNIPGSIVDKFVPYIGKRGNEAKEFLKNNPLRLTEQEALTVSSRMEDWYSDTLTSKYGDRYTSIPEEAKAVVFSLSYHNGIEGASAKFRKVMDSIFAKDYETAATLLEGVTEYRERRKSEAALLRTLIS